MWLRIGIGNTDYRLVKACDRCVVPNTDQETGVVGKEPSRTLKRYRLGESGALFGQNAVPELASSSSVEVCVGSAVLLKSLKTG